MGSWLCKLRERNFQRLRRCCNSGDSCRLDSCRYNLLRDDGARRNFRHIA